MQNLTLTTLKRATSKGGKETILRDGLLRGLILRVRPSGRKLWAVEGTVMGGARRRIALGEWPALALDDARDRAGDMLRQMRAGTDPSAANRMEQARAGRTFRVAADEFVTRLEAGKLASQKRAPRPATVKDARKSFRYLCETDGLGDMPVSQIDRKTVALVMECLADRLAGSGQVKCYDKLMACLRREVGLGYIDRNPVHGIERPAASEARKTVLTEDEVRKVWASGWPPARFLLCVPLRRAALAALDWSWIDLDAGTLSLSGETEGNKAREDFTLALPRQAVAILRDVGPQAAGRVFPDFSADSGATIRKIHRLARTDGGFTIHDFRRTWQSMLYEHATGVLDRDAVELAMQHKRTGVEGVYNRSARVSAQQRVAAQWADVLDTILTGETPEAVVPLRA